MRMSRQTIISSHHLFMKSFKYMEVVHVSLRVMDQQRGMMFKSTLRLSQLNIVGLDSDGIHGTV